jgi:polyferredoxin
MHAVAADIVLAIHFAFVLFVVGGLALIWIGAAAGWTWVRNFWFRAAHLAAIAFVAGEALFGFTCPLTILEDMLRGAPEDKSFIARWVHRVMFFTAPEWVFTALYVSFALLVAATFWFVPPQQRR